MPDTETLAKPNRANRRAAASNPPPVNRARGEATIEVDGKSWKMVLDMRTMAEIEDGLQIDGLHEIEAALARAGSRQMAIVLAALINAGEGREAVKAEDVRRWPVTMTQFSDAVMLAFRGAGAQTDEETGAGK
jgi:hypothetical protein